MNGIYRQRRIEAVASSVGHYRQLDAVAAALGIQHRGGISLDLRCDGAPVQLSLEIDSGSVVGVSISVILDSKARETPCIELRRETEDDRQGKASKIAHEVQTGYEPFDCSVFVDNGATDADAVRLLAAQATRDAVLALLINGCDRVSLTPRAVTATLRLNDAIFPPDRVLSAIEHVMIVSRAGAPRERGVRRGRWLIGPICLWFLGSPFYLWYAWAHWNGGWTLRLTGAAVGVLFWFLVRPILRRLMSGDSGSHLRYQIHYPILIFAPVFFAAALQHLNGALDTSPPYNVVGKVIRVEDIDSRLDNFYVRWSDGWISYEAEDMSVSVGDVVVQERRAGALRFEWHNKALQRVNAPQPVK